MRSKFLLFFLLLSAHSFCQTYKFSTLTSFPKTAKKGPALPDGDLIIDGMGNLYGESSYGGTDNFGTVFKVTPQGVLTVLHSFTGGDDGVNPYGTLARDKAGNLYGISDTMPQVGAQKLIFKLSPKGTLTRLYTFPEGTYPALSLTLDSTGYIYGTSTTTPQSHGNIFKLAPNGTFSVVYDFCPQDGCADGFYPETGLVIDKSGNLYGTTSEGGITDCSDIGCGTVFELTAGGDYRVLHDFAGGSDGIDALRLTQDRQGDLFGATLAGGPMGDGTVFEITANGNYSILYTFCQLANCADGTSPNGGVTLDALGNIYGVTQSDGTKKAVVYEIRPQGEEIVLWKSADAGRQLVIDKAGNLYGTTLVGGSNHNGSIYKLTRTN